MHMLREVYPHPLLDLCEVCTFLLNATLLPTLQMLAPHSMPADAINERKSLPRTITCFGA